MSTMRLEFKDSGAWRRVCAFDSQKLRQVQHAVKELAYALDAGGKQAFRLLNEKGEVHQYCEPVELHGVTEWVWRDGRGA